MGKIERIQVPPEDRERLTRLVRDRKTPQKIVWRAQIVLFAGEGIGAVEVATRVGKSVLTVRRWRRRYAAKGVDGLLKDATRPGGRKPLTASKIKQVVNLTLNEKPPDATPPPASRVPPLPQDHRRTHAAQSRPASHRRHYATHKTPTVQRWLKRHPRFHLHFTPTSGSWLNMVERFFAEITRKRIRRGIFKSVDELKQAIMDYLDNHNGHPKPYVWTKTAAEIFSKVARAKQALESQH